MVTALPAYSQANISDFYQTGAQWQETHYERIGQGSATTQYHFDITGDTLINSISYKKLSLTRTLMQVTNPTGGTTTTNVNRQYGTIGGIRVQNRQVYFLRTKTLPADELQKVSIIFRC